MATTQITVKPNTYLQAVGNLHQWGPVSSTSNHQHEYILPDGVGIDKLYNYIDYLEKIMVDLEGRIEALEERNG